MIKKMELENSIFNGDSLVFSVGVVGELSVGKSTLVNVLLGDALQEESTPHIFLEFCEISDKRNSQTQKENTSKSQSM